MNLDLKKLRELEQEATPGPWHEYKPPRFPGAVAARIGDRDVQVALATGDAESVQADTMNANAALIATMRNALPELLALIDYLHGEAIRADHERTAALSDLATAKELIGFHERRIARNDEIEDELVRLLRRAHPRLVCDDGHKPECLWCAIGAVLERYPEPTS